MPVARPVRTPPVRPARLRRVAVGFAASVSLSLLAPVAGADGVGVPPGSAAGVASGASASETPPPAAAARPDEAVATAAPPAADQGEPAISRASEAGLQRMRVQFAQTVQPALPSADAVDPRALAAPSDPDAARRPVAISRATAATEPLGPRRVSLPVGEAPRLAGQAWAMPLGHASVLLRVNGFTVLADPNFLRRGEHARLFAGIAWPRRDDPALEFAALPRIDLVLLTSVSEDRFDRTVRRMLPRNIPIVAPLSSRGDLVAMGFSSVHGLSDGRTLRFYKGSSWMSVTATPTRPGPPLLGALLPESQGSLLQFGRGDDAPDLQVWLSGATRIDEELADAIAGRAAGVDLALLQVGGRPGLPLLRASMDDDDAQRLAERLKPRRAVVLAVDDHDRGARVARPAPQVASSSASGARAAASASRVPRGMVVHLDRPPRLAAATAMR